jgi:oligoribonuclease
MRAVGMPGTARAGRVSTCLCAPSLCDHGGDIGDCTDGARPPLGRVLGSRSLTRNETNLIWLDLEMTGLDPAKDRILEIATVVTDNELRILADGPVLAIHQPEHQLAEMDEWNRDHHGRSGLLDRVRNSGYDESAAEAETLAFLNRYVPAGASPLCGNSICQDRRFLALWMPRLEAYCHYRNLDVSTLKILAQRWAPEVAAEIKKASRHLALDDIRESIDELAYYRAHLLRGF